MCCSMLGQRGQKMSATTCRLCLVPNISYRSLYTFASLLLCLLPLASPQQAMTGPVWGRHGAVQGVYRQMPGTGRVASFLGIPYAAPPVGEARFQHARPPSPWAGVHRADRHGPACPQTAVDGEEGARTLQLQSEDCLYLNIYSPEKAIHDRQPFADGRSSSNRRVRSSGGLTDVNPNFSSSRLNELDSLRTKEKPEGPHQTVRDSDKIKKKDTVKPVDFVDERRNRVDFLQVSVRDREVNHLKKIYGNRVENDSRNRRKRSAKKHTVDWAQKRAELYFMKHVKEDDSNTIKSANENNYFHKKYNFNYHFPLTKIDTNQTLNSLLTIGKQRIAKPLNYFPYQTYNNKRVFQKNSDQNIPAYSFRKRYSNFKLNSQYHRHNKSFLSVSHVDSGKSFKPRDFLSFSPTTPLSRAKRTSKRLLSVLVIVPGQGYDWGSSQHYDASALSALGHLVVVTFNYRLGTLGFLNFGHNATTSRKGANYGLTDQLAALRWVQDNIMAFGGNPKKVTLLGHGYSAACVHLLMAYTASADSSSFDAQLFHRAVLMSGSAYAPWAVVDAPQQYARQAAEQLGCAGAVDVLMCIRDKPLEEILKIRYTPPQFLSAVGPSVDGVTVHRDWRETLANLGRHGSLQVDLLLGLSESDVYHALSKEADVRDFHSDYRDRILRTFIANNFNYHLQELFLAVSAEYTDWTRPGSEFASVRKLTLQALHDAAVVAPVTATAVRAASARLLIDSDGTEAGSGEVYFYVFNLTSAEGTVMSEVDDVSLVMGKPLSSPSNSSAAVRQLSEAVILLWSNFVRNGNPNSWLRQDSGFRIDNSPYHIPEWPTFRPAQRYYLEFSLSEAVTKDHYRAAKVALWTWLLPSLELIGARYGPDSSFHSLPDDSMTYSGIVRPKPAKWVIKTEYLVPLSTWPPLLFAVPTLAPPGVRTTDRNVLQHAIRLNEYLNSSALNDLYSDSGGNLVERVDGNSSIVAVERSHNVMVNGNTKPAYVQKRVVFPYVTALGITVGLGCTLLLLNVLVWIFIRHKRKKKKRVVIMEEETHIPSTPYLSTTDSRVSPSQQSSSATLETYCDNPTQLVSPGECSQCCHELSQNFPESRGYPLYQNNGGFATLPRPTYQPSLTTSIPIHVESQPLLSSSVYVHDHLSNTCPYDVHPPCITPCTSQNCTEIQL